MSARHWLTIAVITTALVGGTTMGRDAKAESYWSVAADTQPEEATGAVSVASYHFWDFFGSPFLLTLRFDWTMADEIESAHIHLGDTNGPPGPPNGDPNGDPGTGGDPPVPGPMNGGPPDDGATDEDPLNENPNANPPGNPMGQPPTDEPPAEQPPLGQPPQGAPPTDSPPFGEPPTDDPSLEQEEEDVVLDYGSRLGCGWFSISLHTNNDLMGPLAGQTLAELEAAFQAGLAVFELHTLNIPEGIQGPIVSTSQEEVPDDEPPVDEPPVDEPPVDEPPSDDLPPTDDPGFDDDGSDDDDGLGFGNGAEFDEEVPF